MPRRRNVASRAFGRALLAALRWRIEGDLPDLRKFVIAAAPHTSNWDFVVGMAVMFALDLKITFIGKHTLFRRPFGPIMRWMGGVPVDRSSSHGVVGDAVRSFEGVEQRVLAIAPEGTRKRVERFRSGFMHIARGARVPVLLASFDYAVRCLRFGPLIEPGADVEADVRRIEAFFSTVQGKNPRR